MDIIYENTVEEVVVNDRKMRWLVSKNSKVSSDFFTSCVVEFQPGATAKPPHSHPDCEEAIYVMSGAGELLVEGGLRYPLQVGSLIVARKDEVHMIQNSGTEVMRVFCFFTTQTDISKYQMYPLEVVGL
ncbi:MAG: cupin domain-containing protein [Lachnospiraceae bacterium]|nr:cupin domain-containing protein [Lachnospiraceae bacterium]